MPAISPLGRALEAIEDWLLLPVLGGLLAFITIGVFAQVVLRYVFSTNFLWGEEMALFAFIWSIFIGAAVGVRRYIHLSFELFPLYFKGRSAAAHSLLVNLIILAVSVLQVTEGWNFADLNASRLSPAIGFNLFVPTLIIPISGVFMVLAALDRIAADLSKIATGRDA